MLERRTVLQALATAALLPDIAEAASAPRTREDDFMTWAKLTADLSGKTTYSLAVGTVWGFKPQADDVALVDFAKRLYGYQALVVRQAHLAADGAVSIKSKSWTFYQEPQGYTFVDKLPNPYTGLVDDCPPMSGAGEQVLTVDGPRRAAASYPVESLKPDRPYDLRVKVVGDQAFVTETGFTRLQPGGIAWWKLEGQLVSHTCRAADLTNPKLSHIPNTWSHNLIAEWQTWMRMHGTPGHILFKGDGCNVAPSQLPADLRAALEKYFPGSFDEVAQWHG